VKPLPPDCSPAHAQAAAAAETARIRDDHQRALEELTTATSARITAVEETRDELRVRGFWDALERARR